LIVIRPGPMCKVFHGTKASEWFHARAVLV
jgi:hypothetical protein